MTSPTDDELESMVGELLGDSRPPAALSAYAIDVFHLPRLEEELAELVYSSMADDALAGVRSSSAGAAQAMLMTFNQSGLTLDVDWTPGSSIDLTGQVDGADDVTVTVHRVTESFTIATDGLGEFHVGELTEGPVRITCRTGDGRTLHTDWFGL